MYLDRPDSFEKRGVGMKGQKDRQKKSMQRYGIFLLLGSLILTGIMAAAMLRMYQDRNSRIFNSLVEENLTSLHKGQVKEIDASIKEVQTLVKGIAQIYETTDNVDHELNGLYQDAVEKLDILYELDYYPGDLLRSSIQADHVQERDKSVIAKLLEGKSVISDVFPSKQLKGDYAVSVMEPVRKDGATTGVVCGFIKADELMRITTRADYDWASNFLIKQDGSLIMDEDTYYGEDENLFQDFKDMKIAKDKIQEVRDGLASGSTTLVSMESPREGQFFVITTELGYNGWVLMSMTHSNEVKGYSVSIMKNTRMLIISLLIFLAVLLGGAAGIYIQQRERLRRNQARYELLAQFSDTILFEYDCTSKALAFTPNIANHFEVRPEDIRYPFSVGQKFNLLHPDDVETLREMLKDMQEASKDEMEEDVRFLNKDGEYRWMRCQAQLLRDRKGKAIMVVGKFSDIHDQKEQEERLIQKSSIDAMTGAMNRETAEEQIAEKLKHTSSGFFFMLDVDNFKSINDSFGHSAGDSILVQLVREMKKVFRREDVIGRIGGDEFIVFVADVEDRAVAQSKAESLLTRLGKQKAEFTVSMGISAFPSDGSSYQELYKAADAAMYEAKREGKNKFSFVKTNAPDSCIRDEED